MSRKINDLSGYVYGEITVISINRVENGRSFWDCQCSCGRRYVSRSDSIRFSKTGTCGHDRIKNAVRSTLIRITKHGMFKSKTYSSWLAMKNRCTNKNHISNHIYSSVDICHEWLNSFEKFHSDMGDRPFGKTLDRIDNNKGYCKENCRWATPKEQSRNRKNTIHLEINGLTKTLPEWAEIYGINQNTIRCRLKRGVSALDAVSKSNLRVAEWSKA